MSVLAKYALIFETGNSDDWVEKRKKAVQDIRAWYKTFTPSDAVKVASNIATSICAGAALDGEVSTKGEEFIQKYAQSFVRATGQGELQVKVMLAVAAIDLLSDEPHLDSWNNVDALGAAFWSALSHQRPLQKAKVEELRQNLIEVSRDRVQRVAAISRRRVPLPPVGQVNIGQNSAEGSKVNNAFARAVEPLINAMMQNAAKDREELDFMWWLLSERSEILEESLAALSGAVRAVATGFDASAKLRKLPAEAHRHIVLRNVGSDAPVSLQELIEALGERRSKLASGIGEHLVGASAVFPLISAISTGVIGANFTEDKLDASEWGARALLEGAIHHLNANSTGSL